MSGTLGTPVSWSRHLWLIWTVVIAALLGAAIPARTAAASAPSAPVLAVYYAWWAPSSFDPAKMSDLPSPLYNSGDPTVIAKQVAEAQQAGIDAFEVDWYSPTADGVDHNLQTLLSIAHKTGFHVTAYVDLNLITNATDLQNDLQYLQRYTSDPAWFRFQGKPFFAVYHVSNFSIGTWQSILGKVDPNHNDFWMGEGIDMSYLQVFDGMHPFSIAWASDPAGQLAKFSRWVRAVPGKAWMATVMPGNDDTRLRGSAGFVVPRQNGAYYTSVWQGAIATHPDLISITSWNEWFEGTQIEPSQTYGNQYLTLTRQMSDQYRQTMSAASTSAPHSAFYPQAGGGQGGYTISDDGGMTFYSDFQALGGVNALGYPASQRFQMGGFTYQLLQGAVLQWRPDMGHAILANSMDWFTTAGDDDQLLVADSIPQPVLDDGSGGNFALAEQTRLNWLTDSAIRAAYFSAGSINTAVNRYGLPESQPQQHGPFVVQRFQRVVFQHWTSPVAGMPAPGSVVRVLVGDLLKKSALVPSAAMVPQPAS